MVMKRRGLSKLLNVLKLKDGLFLFVVLMSLLSVMALAVDFEDPTLSNGNESESYFTVNVSASDASNISVFINLDNSLVRWWKIDNMSGSIVIDDMGKDNGTLANQAVQIDEGYFGKGLALDGNGDRFDTSQAINGNYTLSMWFKSNNSAAISGNLLQTIGASYPNVYNTAGKVSLKLGSQNWVTSSTTTLYSDLKWHHLVVYVHSDGAGSSDLYVDGVLDEGDVDTTSEVSWGSGGFYIGNNFNGTIDDIMIFNRSLSIQEVQGLYANESTKYLYTNLTGAVGNHTYGAYVQNTSANVNVTLNRNITILIDSTNPLVTINSPYHTRNYSNNVSFNISLNEAGYCEYSLNSGITNYTMITSDNKYFNATNTSIANGDYTLSVYCNDTIGNNNYTVSSDFTMYDHLIYYVDNSSAGCSNDYDKNYASNPTTPYCNISSAIDNVARGDEIVVKYVEGGYCERILIDINNAQGNATSPIIIRGEADDNRTILNGTCASNGDLIQVGGADFYTYRYFEIRDVVGGDAINVNHNGGNQALNVTFENITISNIGSGGQFDGVSFHSNCTGVGRWLNITNVSKINIVDIDGSNTNYYDIYLEGGGDDAGGNEPGILFTTDLDRANHEIYRAIINNSYGCLWTRTNTTVNDLSCINNLDDQISILDDYVTITNFNVSGTPAANLAINISEADEAILINGKFDRNLTILNNSNVIFTNVSYNMDLESVDNSSNLTRNWYLDVSSNLVGVNITLTNSTGGVFYSNITNSSFNVPRQILLSYINVVGTQTYYSNYTISATKSGYVSQSQNVNMTDNQMISFSLSLVASSSVGDTSSGGGTPSFYSKTIVQDDKEFEEIGTIIKELSRKQRMRIKIDDETHYIGVVDLTDTTVTINISSTPQQAVFNIGDEKKFDVTDDNYYDVYVKLNSIVDGKANLTIKSIYEKVIVDDVVEVKEEKKSLVNGVVEKIELDLEWVFGLVVVFVVVSLAVYFKIWKKKKKKKKKKVDKKSKK
ncbi:LamG domain-containing protein [archaeon]|jgi:hypothetical protein|nr:LamG domain-containing protein [archaeon]